MTPATKMLLRAIPESRGAFILIALLGYLFGLSYYVIRSAILDTPEIQWDFGWHALQYVVNYIDYGFLRRGFLGTIFYPVHSLIAEKQPVLYFCVFILDLVVFSFLCFLFHQYIYRCDNIPAKVKTLLVWFFLLSPFGATQFGFDSGRTDHIVFLMVIFAVSLILNGKYILAGIITAMACLVHEITFIFAFPLLVSTVLFSGASLMTREGMMNVAKFAAIPCFITLLLFFYGTPEAGRLDNIPAYYLSMLHYLDAYYRGVFETPKEYTRAWEMPAIVFYAALPLVLLTRIYLTQKWRFDLMYLACFAPCALFPLGYDYARWGFIICMTCLMMLLIKSTRVPIVPHRPAMVDKILLGFIILPLGPIGIIYPLRFVDGVLYFFGI